MLISLHVPVHVLLNESIVLATRFPGDAAKWTAMLPYKAALKQLSERKELVFGPNNKAQFRVGDAVALNLLVKNIRSVLVQVCLSASPPPRRQVWRALLLFAFPLSPASLFHLLGPSNLRIARARRKITLHRTAHRRHAPFQVLPSHIRNVLPLPRLLLHIHADVPDQLGQVLSQVPPRGARRH